MPGKFVSPKVSRDTPHGVALRARLGLHTVCRYFTGVNCASNSVLRPESLGLPNQNAMTKPHPVVSDPSIGSSAWLSLI